MTTFVTLRRNGATYNAPAEAVAQFEQRGWQRADKPTEKKRAAKKATKKRSRQRSATETSKSTDTPASSHA